MCCISLTLQYGPFRYFTGGDLTADTDYGLHPWRDIETPVARRAGPVSVAVANHHAYFDATNPEVVRALKPRAWILPCWHLSHPGMNVMANLFSRDLYPADRSIFAVGIAPQTILPRIASPEICRAPEATSSSASHPEAAPSPSTSSTPETKPAPSPPTSAPSQARHFYPSSILDMCETMRSTGVWNALSN